MSNQNKSDMYGLVMGAWIYKNDRDGTSRKVTFLGIDNVNYVEFAEGWVDVRVSDIDNFSLTKPEA